MLRRASRQVRMCDHVNKLSVAIFTLHSRIIILFGLYFPIIINYDNTKENVIGIENDDRHFKEM